MACCRPAPLAAHAAHSAPAEPPSPPYEGATAN